MQKLPSSIEDNVVATYLPDGYYSEVSETSSMFTHILCYDAEGNMMFRLVQTILDESDEDDILLDHENDPVTAMYINGNEGILVEYPDVPGLYYLVWQDKLYQYSLYGSFTSVSELMKIAEGAPTHPCAYMRGQSCNLLLRIHRRHISRNEYREGRGT